MEGTPRSRLLRWAGDPTVVREGVGEMVVAGVLAAGEPPAANDELVQIIRGGRVWRVVETATRFRAPTGPMTVTLYLAGPATPLP